MALLFLTICILISHYKLRAPGTQLQFRELLLTIAGRTILTLLLLIVTIKTYGQQEETEVFHDSVLLTEVTITGNLPLNNNHVVSFYRSSNFSTIDDVLARMGGISMIKRGAYALEPQLGGFSAGQLNVTVDGMKIFGACTDKMDPITSYIEPLNLKSVKIREGTRSCESGCNVGGAIDLSLEEPETEQQSSKVASLASGYESVSNGRNIQFSSAASMPQRALILSSVYRKYGTYVDGNGKTIPFSGLEKLNVHAGIKQIINKTSSIKTDLLFDQGKNIGYPALPMDVKIARAIITGIEYEHIGNSRLKARIYYNDILHIMDDSKRDSVYYLKNTTGAITDTVLMRMDMPGRSTTFGLNSKYSLPIGNKNRFQVNFDNYTNLAYAEMTMYMHFKDAPPESPMYMQTWPSMLRNVTGLFLQGTRSLNENTTISLNTRLDYTLDKQRNNLAREEFSVLGYQLSKKISNLIKGVNGILSYENSSGLSAELTSGYSERIPTITERYGYYLYNAYDGYDYIGNPNLETEKSFFVGLKAGHSSEHLNVSLSQNFSFMKDYILGETDSTLRQLNFYARGIRRFRNYPQAFLYSAGLQALYKPLEKLALFTSVKYTYGLLQRGTPLPLIPPLSMVVATVYQSGHLMLQSEVLAAIAQTRVNQRYGEQKSDGYLVFNIRGAYKFKVRGTTLETALGLSNLFNKVYYDHLDWSRINRPGRSLEVYLKFTV